MNMILSVFFLFAFFVPDIKGERPGVSGNASLPQGTFFWPEFPRVHPWRSFGLKIILFYTASSLGDHLGQLGELEKLGVIL